MTEPTDTVPSEVRFADPCDMPQLMDLCRLLHEENGWLKMSEDKVHRVLMSHYNRTGGLIGVIGTPDCLQGAVVLQMSSMWYSDEPILEELFSFVPPQFRRSTHAKALIEFAKNTAAQIGVPLLMGLISNERTEAKIDLYRRRLGKPAGAFFVHAAAS